MELENFKISDDFIALEINNEYYDLHNNYDFEEITYNLSKKELKLEWMKSEGDWVKSGLPLKVRIVFTEVYIFKSQERDGEIPFSEDTCLDSLGFIDNSFIDEVAGFASNVPTQGANHLNISFSSGFAMKIGAKKARLETLAI